jgi:putative transposase
MGRVPRLIQDGSYYHVHSRGNNKRKIFRYNRDYLYFKKLIIKYMDKYPVCIYHYCLMKNHMHFLVKVIEAVNVPKFFQCIFQSYAAYFRNQHNYVGHLFQNRYKSHPINNKSYLLECARYIERNPLRPGVVDDLEKYKWSSYLFYAKGYKDGIIKEPNPLYLEMGKDDSERRQCYRDYLLQERPYDLIVDKALRTD